VTRVIDKAAPYAAQSPATGDDPVWLTALRQEAMARFQAEGFPTLRTEAWKYTNLDRLTRTVFTAPEKPGEVPEAAFAPLLFPKDRSHRLVFVDGHFVSALSDIGTIPEGVSLVSLGRMLEWHPEPLESRLGRIAALDGAPLAALNLALMGDGAALIVPDGIAIENPVHIVHVSTGTHEAAAHHLRHLIVLGEGSAATVVESRSGIGMIGAWTNVVTEAALGRNAHLRYCACIDETAQAIQTARLALSLGRDSSVEAMTATVGGGLVRNEVVASLAGEGCEARIDGIALGRGRQHTDTWTEIVHAAPRSRSRQVFKAVLDDRSRSAFQGRVVVREGAQKIDAHQLNRNLLLSPQARADSKPELEILADDVKCSHGSTVGDLDRDALFYLRSRGLPAAEARALMVEAFVVELLDTVSSVPVRDWLRLRLDSWLEIERRERKAA